MRQEINFRILGESMYPGIPSLLWFPSTLYFRAQLFSAETAFSCVQLCRQADQLNHSWAKIFFKINIKRHQLLKSVFLIVSMQKG